MASIKTIFSGLQSPRQGVGDVKTAIHPRDASGFLSASTFSWCNRLISVGNERQLAPSDIWELQARKDKTAGDIANLFSVDVVNVMGLSANMNMAWIVPIQ
ncbi:hypothetical protein DYB28_011981, partial [Aphanomyces astaci]